MFAFVDVTGRVCVLAEWTDFGESWLYYSRKHALWPP